MGIVSASNQQLDWFGVGSVVKHVRSTCRSWDVMIWHLSS